jgi:S1-C subfamily serine protease
MAVTPSSPPSSVSDGKGSAHSVRPPQPPRRPQRRGSRGWAAAGAGVLLLGVIVGGVFAAGVFSHSRKHPPPLPPALTAAQVAAKLKASTVLVVSRGAPGSPMVALNGGHTVLGAGSGWVYDASQGLIVTNAHVVIPGASVQAGYNGSSLQNASIVGVDLEDDIAVLKVPPAMLTGITTLHGASSGAAVGATVYVMGYPVNGASASDMLKTPQQLTSGLISTTGASITVNTDFGLFANNDNAGALEQNLVQTTAATNEGDSGGPLVNDHGQLVGMNVAKSVVAEGQGYAIPLATIDQVVPELAAGHSIGWAGIGAVAVPTDFAAHWAGSNAGGLAPPGGLIVTSIANDTPADQGAFSEAESLMLKKGFLMVVTAVNHQDVSTAQQFEDALKSVPSGAQITLDVAGLNPNTGLLAVDAGNGYTWGMTIKTTMP